MAKWYPTLSLPKASFLAASVGIVGAVVAAGGAIAKVFTPAAVGGLAQIKSPLFLVPSALVALLGAVGKFMTDRLAPGQKEASIQLLKQRLEEYERLAADQKEPGRYNGFINDICARLQRSDKPRIVVVHCCPVKSRTESVGWGFR